ncbi:MAG: PAS domain S-box protein [Candidatus Scalindua sp.]
MKIKTKFLGAIYIYIIVVALLALGFAYYHHRLVSKRIDSILYYENKLELISQLELSIAKLLMPANDYLIHGSEDERHLFHDADTEVNRIFKILEADNLAIQIAADEQEALSRLKDKYFVVRNISVQILDLSGPVGNAEGAVMMEEMDSIVDGMLNDMKVFHKNNRLNVLVEIEVIDAYFYKYMIIVLGILAATGICAFFYGYFLSRWIILPVKRLIQYMGFVEEGDLSRRLDINTKDEIGFLSNSFNNMVCTIRERAEVLNSTNKRLESEITEREKIANSLIKFEEKYRKLIDTAQDAIIGIGEDGVVSIWNKSAEKIFGYSEGEIKGKPVTTIIPERYREQHENGLRKFLKTGEARIIGSTVEVSGITKEGLEIPIEMSLSFQKNEECQYTFTAIIRDITERKTREEEIQKLSHAIEQSPVSIVITDTEGNIEYVNRKFVEVTGYTSEEVIGKSPRVLKSDETTSEEYKELWETITSGNEWRGEFSNKNKEGEIYWEAASISPVMNRDGKISHFIAVKEDITERKKMEDVLHKKTKLVHLLQDVAVAANEAHSVEEAMRICLGKVCEFTGFSVGHVYLLDSEETMIPSGIWYFDRFKKYERFKKVTETNIFKKGVGLPGRVLESGEPAWITDLTKDSNFPRAKLVDDIVVKSGFAFPVLEQKKVVAVLEFFSSRLFERDDSLLQAIQTLHLNWAV